METSFTLMRNAELKGGTPARPNKFRKRKRFASKPFKFATFVSPLPKKFAAQYFSGTPVSLRSNCHIERERNIFIMRVKRHH